MKKKTPPAPHSKWDPNYPYEVDYNDHFETPLRAYEDIAPLLDLLSPAHSSPTTTTTKRKKKQQRTHEQQQQLRQKNTLYDPYYCNGRAAHHLRSLGYTKIKHEKRDFYDDIARGTTPSYNTLITNPPYSCDHKEKCLEYAVNRLRGEEGGVPFFLLMPAYVASKRYYRRIVADKNGKEPNDIIYLLPSHRYEYDHPEGTGRDLAPFESIWFCGIGKGRWKSATNAYANFEPQRVKLLSSWEELGNNGVVSTKRRLNPRQRKKLRERMQRKNDANVSGDVTNNERCRRETAKSETKVTTTAEGQSRKKRGGDSLSTTRETLVPSKKRKKSDEVVFSRKKRNFKTTPT